MEDIVEILGLGLLDILGGAGTLAILFSFVNHNGIIFEYILDFMQGICG